VLQALYNLSDDQAEYQLRDRLSSMRFLGLELEDTVPDAKTLWLYREALGKRNDRRHKFVRRYVVSDASVHDRQKFEDVLDASNTSNAA
jgi:Transposase domain (DUF772)